MSDDGKRRRDYEVGYGRPPSWTRFRKGESGNPHGRPPRKRIEKLLEASATDKAVRAELDRMLKFTENGKVQQASVRSLLVKALVKNGLSGENDAIKLAMNLSQTLDRNNAERAKLEQQEKRETFDAFKRLRDRQSQIWARAALVGEEPDEPWPHPDDILLDPAMLECEIRGPYLAKEIPLFEYFRTERDVAFADVLFDIVARGEVSEPLRRLKVLAWLSWDRLLPLRWQYWPQFDDKVNELTLRPQRLRSWSREREEEVCRMRRLFVTTKQQKWVERKVNRLMRPFVASEAS